MSRTLMPDPATAKSARPAMAAPATQRRAVRAVMRDPEVVCSSAAARGSTGRSERSDSGRAERRGGAGRWAWEWQTRGDGRDARQSRAPREPGGSRPFPATTITDKRNEMSPRDLATRARARGQTRLSRSGVCRCVITPWLAVDFDAEHSRVARGIGASPPTPTPEGVFHFLPRGGWASRRASAQHVIFAHISVINFCT